MSYRFQPGEPVPEGVRRIVCEELESAAERLRSARGPARDAAIHEARKSIKKTRALLRLLQPKLGPVYDTWNTRLRDIGLRLSALRDAGVLFETLSHLEQEYKDELGGRAFASVRRALARHKRETERRAGLAAHLARVAAALDSAARRSGKWLLRTDGFPAIASGFEHTFRRGRKALARARKEARPENDHTLRKRVKDHLYHVRLLAAFGDEWLEAYERNLKELDTWLGECHNLVVLREQLEAGPGTCGTAKDRELLRTLVDRREHELRAKALTLGARIYGRKARLLVRRIERLWESRQSGGASVSAASVPAGTRAARRGRR
jgi:CHAD domain-containing protein